MLLLFVLSLSGCEDNDKEIAVPKKSSIQIAHEAKDLLETPPPPPKVSEEIQDLKSQWKKIIQKNLKASELSAKASILRSQRKARYHSLFKSPEPENRPKKYQLQDKDYGELPKDLSTLPVDRSRTLTTDMRINAVLDDDINSQIPGVVIAIVDKPVFSPNNRFILLPVFTKMVCEYQGLELQGQTRLPMTCTRAIRPDGVSISLSDAIVADQLGRTGLTGEVDNRTFEMYSGAFIMAGISALAQSGVHQEQPYWWRNSQTILANNIGQITADVIRRNIDLRPVIYIKAGTRLQIRPKVDIVLKEPIPLETAHEVNDEKVVP